MPPPTDPLELAKEILGGHVAYGLCPSMNVTRLLLSYVQAARQNPRTAKIRRPEGHVLHGKTVAATQTKQLALAYLQGRRSLTAEEVCDLAVTVLCLTESIAASTAH